MREWDLHRGTVCSLPITPRHRVEHPDLVALVVARHDLQYGRFARVLSLEQGKRRHRDRGYIQECLLAHLVFSSGDHGLWALPPLTGTDPLYPFHYAPSFYARKPSQPGDNPAISVMEYQGAGFSNFYTMARMLRNGTAQKIPAEYEALFQEPFPLKQI